MFVLQMANGRWPPNVRFKSYQNSASQNREGEKNDYVHAVNLEKKLFEIIKKFLLTSETEIYLLSMKRNLMCLFIW